MTSVCAMLSGLHLPAFCDHGTFVLQRQPLLSLRTLPPHTLQHSRQSRASERRRSSHRLHAMLTEQQLQQYARDGMPHSSTHNKSQLTVDCISRTD